MSSYKKVSLSEIKQSIETPNNNHFGKSKVFLGPGALVAVGYMDPENWITSVVGGASYKYSLFIRYFDFIHHRHAATTDGWKARYRDEDGFSAGNSSSCPQVAPL